jgi:hypothetical protein
LAGDYIKINGVIYVMQKIKFLVVLVLTLVAASTFAQSCPMCKESMTQAGAKLSEGFYYSIISMFTLPVSLIGLGTVFVMKKSWKRSHPEAENLSTVQVIKEMIREKRKG